MNARNIAEMNWAIIDFNQKIKAKNPNWGIENPMKSRNEYVVKGPSLLNKTVYGREDLYRQLFLICNYLNISTYEQEVLPPKWLNSEALERWYDLKRKGRMKYTGKYIERFGKRITIYSSDPYFGEVTRPTKQIIFFIEFAENGELVIEPVYYFDDEQYLDDKVKFRALRDWNHSIWDYVELKKIAPSEAIHRLTKVNKELFLILVKTFGFSLHGSGVAVKLAQLVIWYEQRGK